MDDKGDIISSCEIDKNITLGIWSKEASPRLSIENNAKKTGAKRKLIRLNWVERRDRKLSISGAKRNENLTYEISQLEPAVKKILGEYAVYSKFKAFYWKTLTLLSNMTASTVNILDPAEIALMPDKKRFFLWISDMTESREEGFFRPFFPRNEKEQKEFPAREGIPFSGGNKSPDYIQKSGIMRKLMGIYHARWYRPLQIAAAAMLLNFSFCGEDGSEMADVLWEKNRAEPLALRPDDPRLVRIGERLNLYIRHFEDIDKIGYEEGVFDSVAELQKREYSRKRRFNVPMGAIGDVEYTVTFFEKEDAPVAVACVPGAATARHERDIVFHIDSDVMRRAEGNDTIPGGNTDEHYSLSALIKAKQFSDWLERVAFFVSDFTGVTPKSSSLQNNGNN